MGEFVRAEAPEGTRRRRRGCCLGLLVVLTLPLLIWLVAVKVTDYRVERELDRVRRRGEPVTLSDAVKPIPVGQPNAAILYLAPQPREPQPAPRGVEVRPNIDTWSPEHLAQARAAVAANQPYYQSVLAAARVQPCSFPEGADGSYRSAQRRTEQVWQEARALEVLAELQSHDGDVNAAAATCLALFRMAGHMGTAPTSLDHSRAREIHSLALDELARVLTRATPSEAVLAQLSRQLALYDALKAATAELVAARTTGLATLSRLEKGELPELLRSAAPMQGDLTLVLELTAMRPRWNTQKLQYVRLMARAVAAMAKPWPEVRKDVDALEREVQDAPVSSVVGSRRVIPSLSHVLYVRQHHAARAGGAQVALALRRWRLRHGQYPTSLAPVERELGALPRDPYSHQPFHFRAGTNSLVVWSVGAERAASRGVDPTREPPGADLAFICDRTRLSRADLTAVGGEEVFRGIEREPSAPPTRLFGGRGRWSGRR